MKLGHPAHSRRLAVLGLASAIALGTTAMPATANTTKTPRPTPSDFTFVKYVDKASPSLTKGGSQGDYMVLTMNEVLISN